MADIDSPYVTLLLVTYNCRDVVEKALQSYCKLAHPAVRRELVIVDGKSTDGTAEFLQEWAADHSMHFDQVSIISNPARTLATGWNIGIRQAKGEFVLRIDAHSEVTPSYLVDGIALLQRSGESTGGVGGRLMVRQRAATDAARAVSNLIASRFGTGNSPFRNPKSSEPFSSDTALFAVYRRSLFDQVGQFNEDLERAQDIEFHARARSAGFGFITNPAMVAYYYALSDVREFVKKAYKTGRWAVLGRGARFRHVIPAAFVTYVIAFPFLSLLLSQLVPLLTMPLLAYAALVVVATVSGPSLGRYFWIMPAFHISYGLGGISGLITRVRQRIGTR